MREAFFRPSHGVEAVRSFFCFAAAALLAALFVTITTSEQAAAQSAVRDGVTIVYEDNTYAQADAATVSDLGLLNGTTAYTYRDTSTTPPQMRVIFFASDVDANTANTGRYVVYTQNSNGTWSNTSPPSDIAINQNDGSTGPSAGTTSCAIEGIGFIICPVSNFLAQSMDYIFDILAGFLVVEPLNQNHNSALYRAWSIMRSFANIAFAIAFMMIIYSQLTNIGLSNYGIKRLLPRIILAAIFVNLSYLICTLAVDISNILGFGFQNLFIDIRNSLVGSEGNTWDLLSWSSITSAVLAGAAALTVAGISISVAVATGFVGAIALLLPTLVGGILAVLVALLIMAVRQALITILIVISPLAFVAYLLPNTEKWFSKWRGIFTTMLVLFPAFSIIFGGSQLAASIIIQNANSINVIILALAIQVAPLFVTPFLIRLSGSLVGRLAGMVNNPNKGLIDRTRNWSQDRYANYKANRLGNPARRGVMGIGQRHAQRLNRNRLNREGWRNIHQDKATNDFNESEAGRRLHEAAWSNERAKTTIANHHDTATHRRINARGSDFHLANMRMEASKAALERAKATTAADVEEYKTGRHTAPIGELSAVVASMRPDTIQLAAENRRNVSAHTIQQQDIAQALKNSIELRRQAGGIDGENGAQRALADATATISKATEEAISNAGKIMSNLNLSNAEMRTVAEGGVVGKLTASNIPITVDLRAAALRQTFGGPDTGEIDRALRNVDLSFSDVANPSDREDLRIVVADALQANSAKPPQITASMIGNLKQGFDFNGNALSNAYGTTGVNEMIIAAINNQKIDAGKLQTMGKDYADAVLNAVAANFTSLSDDAKTRLARELDTTLDPNREASERLGDSRPKLEDIRRYLP